MLRHGGHESISGRGEKVDLPINKVAGAAMPAEEMEFRRLLPYLSLSAVRDLLRKLDVPDLRTVGTPSTGLVMMTALDAFGEPFYLGEILVSTAEVECGRVRGHATVIGDSTDKALIAARVDALRRIPAYSHLLADFYQALHPYLENARARIEEENRVYASTRVHFESMAPEKQ